MLKGSPTLSSKVDLLREGSAVVEEEGSGSGPLLCHVILWCGHATSPLSSSFVTVMDCGSLCGFLLSCLSLRDKNSLCFSLSVNIQQAAQSLARRDRGTSTARAGETLELREFLRREKKRKKGSFFPSFFFFSEERFLLYPTLFFSFAIGSSSPLRKGWRKQLC